MDIAALNGALMPPPRRHAIGAFGNPGGGDFNNRLQQQMQSTILPGAVSGVGKTGQGPGIGAGLTPGLDGKFYRSGIPSALMTNGVSSWATAMNGGLPAGIEWPPGQDVSQWPETMQIKLKGISGGRISWEESGDRLSWPNRGGTNANAWIIREVEPGRYEARTWEYVRPNQTVKSVKNIVNDMNPRSGERVGIMLAGITRDPRARNIEARSNVEWLTWP